GRGARAAAGANRGRMAGGDPGDRPFANAARMSRAPASRSDALVLFGVTGDLARKKIFPALYALAKRGALEVPVVGVAGSKITLAEMRERAEKSVRDDAKVDDAPALRRMLSLLRYVSG